jgi:alginate O-acetyltransferase complex protein AlgJ
VISSSSVRGFIEGALIVCFLGIIGLPLIGRAVALEDALALTENRLPAPFPSVELRGWSLVSFPRRFERYWNDNFVFRRVLIRWHSLLKIPLGVSPSAKTVLGHDGYLFYAGQQSIDYYRAVKPFTPAAVARWRQELETRRAWLAARGIRYLVVVAPNKETIYPEYMPEALTPVRKATRLDQFMEHVRASSTLDVLDLRESLRAAKPGARVYHRTDTHWNDAGAFVAYEQILARLHGWFPEMRATPAAVSWRTRVTAGGDLARLIALEDRFPEEQIELIPVGTRRANDVTRQRRPRGRAEELVAMECPSCGGPRAVMFHDSFNTNLAPLLAEHFSRVVYSADSFFDRILIEDEDPDVVIQEFVERVLMCTDLRTC